ncbi:hypothetical protein C922_04235 [Plasmodium inui San Antonio 1]|uniref:Uncharacterized protein n=1 Tax=Plasmodium inui San Antonio 1 TaxID=1237626 RepID=W6ZWW6_9APIC|nr:hypothetical protein C922_04235 [Plasmodium inui San Antonio 1]EUD65292.1 hypothetical protein C922_04235 [Plasmodium inui San Antonio 1]
MASYLGFHSAIIVSRRNEYTLMKDVSNIAKCLKKNKRKKGNHNNSSNVPLVEDTYRDIHVGYLDVILPYFRGPIAENHWSCKKYTSENIKITENLYYIRLENRILYGTPNSYFNSLERSSATMAYPTTAKSSLYSMEIRKLSNLRILDSTSRKLAIKSIINNFPCVLYLVCPFCNITNINAYE